MKLQTFKAKLIESFAAVILFIGIAIMLLGFYVLKNDVIKRTQQQVRKDLQTARSVYQDIIYSIESSFLLLGEYKEILKKKDKIDVDYLFFTENLDTLKSEIAKEAAKRKKGVGGTRIISRQELMEMGPEIVRRSQLKIKETRKARPTQKTRLDEVMALEYAMPVFNNQGSVAGIIYGGKIINRRFDLVDRIRDLVFENKLYNGKALGTVTIFQDDVRIATNVLDEQGKRAVGTRVSEEVYNAVVKERKIWGDRAFVVTDWYLTAYEPIMNIKGDVIGILYVGILEKPFLVRQRQLFVTLLGIIVCAGLLAALLAVLLAAAINNPVQKLLKANLQLSKGDLEYRLKNDSSILELQRLYTAFNEMADKLNERELSLRKSNEKLAMTNKNYLDLVGFVSHELKGILSSLVLNVYNLRKELLGPMNESQKKTLNSVSRNLDYLNSTVVNFLNLSRIEKDELALKKSNVKLKKDVIDAAVESFARLAQDRQIKVINNVPAELDLYADRDLMIIVANNLLSNALKYGISGGKVQIEAEKDTQGNVRVEIYNDGEPIAPMDVDKLFKKFSRLNYAGMAKVKGTGIGLFITKRIIEQHEGTIHVEPRAGGNAFIFSLKANHK